MVPVYIIADVDKGTLLFPYYRLGVHSITSLLIKNRPRVLSITENTAYPVNWYFHSLTVFHVLQTQ